jgi:multisubunit Na+/H+ antiporter MnhB subunit
MSFAVALAICGLLIGLGMAVILLRNSFAAVCAFIALGLLLTMVWLQLRGVDVALTEAAIGAGLTGALLIGAVVRMRGVPEPPRATRGTILLATLAGLGVTGMLGMAVLALPTPAPTLAPLVADHLGATGMGNPITAVLLAFRSMDTLLEVIVLLFALVAVWSLAPDASWPGRPGWRAGAPPGGILAFLARLLPPIGLVVGAYVFWAGDDAPGGTIQGATILASMWLLVMAAGLADVPRAGSRLLRAGLVAGPLAFIVVGVFGIGSAGAFLGLPPAIAKPTIILIELALLPTLTLILALLIPGPPQRPAEGAP